MFNKEFPYLPQIFSRVLKKTIPCFCDNGKAPDGHNCKVCGGTGRRPVKNIEQSENFARQNEPVYPEVSR